MYRQQRNSHLEALKMIENNKQGVCINNKHASFTYIHQKFAAWILLRVSVICFKIA